MGKLWIASWELPVHRMLATGEIILCEIHALQASVQLVLLLARCRAPSMEQTTGSSGLQHCAERVVRVDADLKLLLGNGLHTYTNNKSSVSIHIFSNRSIRCSTMDSLLCMPMFNHTGTELVYL